MKISIGIIGLTGKMGQSIKNIAENDCNIAHIWGINSNSSIEAAEKVFKQSDVIIDFSLPESLKKYFPLIEKHPCPIVIGTTGYSKEDLLIIEKMASKVPVMLSSNFSLGIAFIKNVLKSLDEKIKSHFELSIEETHHNKKKDAPSGTALALQESIGLKIPIKSHRHGDVIGEHTVSFSSPTERVSIKHQALKREVFATGALMSAKFMLEKEPGRIYTIDDFFNEK